MAPEYNTFSSNAKAVALTLLTIVSSTSAMDSVPITVPHAIVERYEMTSSSLQLEEYDSFKLDLSAKKISGKYFIWKKFRNFYLMGYVRLQIMRLKRMKDFWKNYL